MGEVTGSSTRRAAVLHGDVACNPIPGGPVLQTTDAGMPVENRCRKSGLPSAPRCVFGGSGALLRAAVRRLAALGALCVVAAVIWPAEPAHADAFSRSNSLLSGRIDTGYWDTCAIVADGKLYCWGYGNWGTLGNGNTEDVGDDETPAEAGPVDIGAGRTAVQVSGGEGHMCAVLDNGTVRCWGFNASGQLGYGNTERIGDDETPAEAGPVDLGAGRTAVQVSAGASHSCALLDNGTVRCWGFGSYGALGYGNKANVGDDETPGSVAPVDLGAGRTAVQISVGGGSTCALLDNGTVLCWGFGYWGSLGYGSTESIGDNETPGSVGPVNLGAGRRAVAISAAGGHTCALLDNGSVKCWGTGVDGRLGYGNTNDILSPSSVGTVNLGAGRTAVRISAGTSHTCALLDNGTVLCWGEGLYGQLGYANQSSVGDNETPASVGPVDLGAGRKAIAIMGGKYFTCALLDTGAVRCWGESFYGQLGYGSTDRIGDNETPAEAGPVDLGTAHGVRETATGTSHSCALLDTGAVRCWGLNSSGQLGYGNTTMIGDNESPGAAGPVDLGERSAVQLAAGEAHTCALLDDGTVRCWGRGTNGQLGNGSTESVGDNETLAEAGPVDLGGESAVVIAAGANHTCALTTTGAVRCWGLNSSGQLGYGNTLDIGDDETPGSVGPVSLGLSATAIFAGANHTCARLDDGTLRCWGLGTSGRLGYANTNTIGDNEMPSTAGAVNVGRNPTVVSAGGSHTCARLDDGTLRCWGLGTSGRLGYANTNTIGDNETPSTAGAISVGRSATAIAAGGSHTCTRFDDGGVRCWGLNSSGQLGYGNTETIGDNETPSLVGTVDLGTGRSALSLSTGADHTCATLENGTLRCWGLNSSGQLGYGNTETIGDNETPGSVGPVDFEDDPPTAVDDSVTVNEDTATPLDVLANDTDPDGSTKLIEAKTDGTHGTVSIAGGGTGLTYTPEANYCGPDSFTYQLNGGSEATVSVSVTCVDDLPTAVEDEATLPEDAGATAIPVLANDTDIDGGPKEIVAKTDGTHGTVSIAGGGTGLTYTPEANYCGPDSFTYQLNGGSEATVSVTVTCADDPPVAVNDSATMTEDSGPEAVAVLANDTDVDGGSKAVAAKTNGAHGTVAITGGGTGLSYTPDASYCGPDSFSYQLNGGSEATVSITVTCVDDAPNAVNDSDTVSEDSGAGAIDVLANDTDIDGGLRSIVGRTNGSHGSVAIIGAGAGLTYTPEANYCGPDSFTYTLNGGSAGTVSITVTCVEEEAAPTPSPSSPAPSSSGDTSSPRGSSTVVNITPGVGVLSGRHRPRVAIKGIYAFFTLTCKFTDRDCRGKVIVNASVPSVSLGASTRKVTLVKGRFRIGARRSVLVRARLRRRGRRLLGTKRSLRGIGGQMAIVDVGNGERGSIEVTLVRRPRASLLPEGKRKGRSSAAHRHGRAS